MKAINFKIKIALDIEVILKRQIAFESKAQTDEKAQHTGGM